MNPFDEAFLSDIKTTVTSAMTQWLNGFKDPVERAKALLTRCKRASLLQCTDLPPSPAESRDLKLAIGTEVASIPPDATDMTASTRLQILEAAFEALCKNRVDSTYKEREQWYELAHRFVLAVEEIARRK